METRTRLRSTPVGWRPDFDAGVAYLLLFFAAIVVFMIWVYNLPY